MRCMNAEETENRKSDTSPEKELWTAVVMTAWNDFFEHEDVPVPPSGSTKMHQSMRSQALARNRDRYEARQFLLEEYGPWARSRRDVCDLAGIDPDWLRERALRQMEKPHERSNSFVRPRSAHLSSGMDR